MFGFGADKTPNQRFQEFLNNGVEAKRNGKYADCINNYKMAEGLLGTGQITIENVYILYKSLGKIHYIFEEYDKAIDSYIRCFDVAEVTEADLKHNPQNYENELMHLGYAFKAKFYGVDCLEAYAYRCSIDPYFATNDKSSYASQVRSYNSSTYDTDSIELAYSILLR